MFVILMVKAILVLQVKNLIIVEVMVKVIGQRIRLYLQMQLKNMDEKILVI